MKILIVEDEPKTGDYLRQGLSEAGYVVDLARDGLDGLHLAQTGDYDLIVLDVMLPGLDGWGVLQTVRRGNHEMPVLFLTARDQVEDRVRGLELGADDYLGKPFDLGELGARLRALIRRDDGRVQPITRIGALTIDQSTRCVTFSGQAVDLSRREFAVLEVLARRTGNIVSRSQIEDAIYGWQEEVGSNAVEVHIHKLRGKLDAETIETVRGVGYRLRRT